MPGGHHDMVRIAWLCRTVVSVLLGGGNGTSNTFNFLNDVWHLQPVGSSVKNPNHIYTKSGRYQVALQAYNANGYNNIRKAGYINVTGAPTVTSVSPKYGPPAGGTPVIITGTGFTDATGVSFGAIALPTNQYVIKSDTDIDAVSPQIGKLSGIVDVRVANPAGSSQISASDEYFYVATVSKVSPNKGPVKGNNTITITGTNFNSATGVYFSPDGLSSRSESRVGVVQNHR